MSTNAPSSSSTLTYADIAARPIVLTVKQAAERLGIGRTLMYSLVERHLVDLAQPDHAPAGGQLPRYGT